VRVLGLLARRFGPRDLRDRANRSGVATMRPHGCSSTATTTHSSAISVHSIDGCSRYAVEASPDSGCRGRQEWVWNRALPVVRGGSIAPGPLTPPWRGAMMAAA
jgi:hypothetical protein